MGIVISSHSRQVYLTALVALLLHFAPLTRLCLFVAIVALKHIVIVVRFAQKTDILRPVACWWLQLLLLRKLKQRVAPPLFRRLSTLKPLSALAASQLFRLIGRLRLPAHLLRKQLLDEGANQAIYDAWS